MRPDAATQRPDADMRPLHRQGPDASAASTRVWISSEHMWFLPHTSDYTRPTPPASRSRLNTCGSCSAHLITVDIS